MAKFQAPPIRTPFIGNPPKVKLGSEKRDSGEFSNLNVPSYAWTNWFQSVTNALSTPSSVPTSSNFPGTPGQQIQDANFAYFCVAKNTWRRVALSAF